MSRPRKKKPDAADAETAADVIEVPEATRPPRLGLFRQTRKKPARATWLIAFDYETTRIQAGTPRPLYLTAFGEKQGPDRPGMHFAAPIGSQAQNALILQTNFLIPQYAGARFVAWNSNNFDSYFVAAAAVTLPGFIIRPYLTRSGSLRGLRVIKVLDESDSAEEWGDEWSDKEIYWEFLDGIAMLGLVGVNLAKFTANFAPNHQKLSGVIDFEKEEFDSSNPKHCEYAMVDSVGLWHGMMNAQNILLEHFGQPLAVTMGGACIKIFKAHIPEDVKIRPLSDEVISVVRHYVMRGGYCYSVRPFKGKVWKYDLNQAYASAMRETRLPSGSAFHSVGRIHPYASVYIAKVEGWNSANKIPFYCRTEFDGKVRSVFAERRIPPTWLTSIEIEQLRAEDWTLKVHESYFWDEDFSMQEYVDKLERGRMAAPGGPAGPTGTVYKNVGNHSYGKTVEQIDGDEYLIAIEQPPGFMPYYRDNEIEPLPHVWRRTLPEDEIESKDYHQPQIGAFITAYVRMVVRRAALIDPDAWIYADTDCVVFTRDVTASLDIHAKRYGAWKIEEAGTEYMFIAKKVYSQIGIAESNAARRKAKLPEAKRSTKGLHVDKLDEADFLAWFEGVLPAQDQVQKNNFLRVMRGAEMYRSQARKGTDPIKARKNLHRVS